MDPIICNCISSTVAKFCIPYRFLQSWMGAIGRTRVRGHPIRILVQLQNIKSKPVPTQRILSTKVPDAEFLCRIPTRNTLIEQAESYRRHRKEVARADSNTSFCVIVVEGVQRSTSLNNNVGLIRPDDGAIFSCQGRDETPYYKEEDYSLLAYFGMKGRIAD